MDSNALGEQARKSSWVNHNLSLTSVKKRDVTTKVTSPINSESKVRRLIPRTWQLYKWHLPRKLRAMMIGRVIMKVNRTRKVILWPSQINREERDRDGDLFGDLEPFPILEKREWTDHLFIRKETSSLIQLGPQQIVTESFTLSCINHLWFHRWA